MSKFPLRRFLLPSVLVLTAVLATGEARAQGGDARVPVVHGVPDLPVDVYVNHELTREGVEPATITDPLTFPAGDYTIDVREAGAAQSSDPAITTCWRTRPHMITRRRANLARAVALPGSSTRRGASDTA